MCSNGLPADIGLYLQWNMFGMKEVERPAPVLVVALNHNFDGQGLCCPFVADFRRVGGWPTSTASAPLLTFEQWPCSTVAASH